jgi:hypothetical protein
VCVCVCMLYVYMCVCFCVYMSLCCVCFYFLCVHRPFLAWLLCTGAMYKYDVSLPANLMHRLVEEVNGQLAQVLGQPGSVN